MHQYQKSSQQGLTVAGLLVILAIIIGLSFTGVLLIGQERARVRDSVRIAHLTQFSAAMRLLYGEKGSYVDAARGCAAKGAFIHTCALDTYLANAAELKDPGHYKYSVSEVPSDTGYGVTFTLERGFGKYARGQHVLTQNGIK